MANPGPDGPPEPSHNKRHYRKAQEQAEQATTTMMDQQNFEATRPVSADPAVALAEALGQLPKAPPKIPSPKAKFETAASSAERAIHSFAPTARRSVRSAPSSA